MKANSKLLHFLRPRSLLVRKPISLLPITAADELPARGEKLTLLYGRRRRVLDPNWALVPKDR